MISSIFSGYLMWNLVLAAAVLGLVVCARLSPRLSARAQLKLHYAVFLFACLVPVVAVSVRGGEVFKPIVHVWSEGSLKIPAAPVSGKKTGLIYWNKSKSSVPADPLFLFWIGAAGGAILVGAFYLLKARQQLNEILNNAWSFKKIGRVSVLISDVCRTPFSYRSFTRAYVVLPDYLLGSPQNIKLALAHELQHHRQQDTLSVYLLFTVNALCFFNPLVYGWRSWIGELQEFACDEALLGRRANAQAYARCLIEVAENAWVHDDVSPLATGMLLLNRGQLLNRRIQSMFQKSRPHDGLKWAAPFAMIAMLLTTTAFAAKNLVQDRRISMAQAQELAKTAQKGAQFPITINEEVLYWLNHFAGTPEGREQARKGLRGMETYRNMVTMKLSDYQAPQELMAIPLIESCYQNLEDRNVQGYGAGLWMFIVSTARVYGLFVHEDPNERYNAKNDQRLDEVLETDAAMRYLVANKLRFNDWQLSVLAYNAGESAVQREMDRLNTRDVWKLIREGNLSKESKNYLPKLIAAILIMRSPSIVQ